MKCHYCNGHAVVYAKLDGRITDLPCGDCGGTGVLNPKHPVWKKMGEKLRRERERLNLGLNEACRLTGYNAGNLSKMERGLIHPISVEKLYEEDMRRPYKSTEVYTSIYHCLMWADQCKKDYDLLKAKFFKTIAGLLYVEYNLKNHFKEANKAFHEKIKDDILTLNSYQFFKKHYSPDSESLFVVETFDSIESCRLLIKELEERDMYISDIVKLNSRKNGLTFKKLPLQIQTQNNQNTEPYYFKTAGWDHSACVEECMLKGCMIGSVTCQRCENCVDYNIPCEHTGEVSWIKCKRLKEAKGK